MAQMTSAMAAKYLKKLNEEHEALLRREKKTMTFTAAIQENKEEVRPEYDYGTTQEQLLELERKIRTIKHEINVFNLNQVIPSFDMTVDQMLVYIPQLTARKNKLDKMRSRLPKERVQDSFSRNSALVEYEYSNYDIQQVEVDYNKVADELARAQNALDKVNSTVTFEMEIE